MRHLFIDLFTELFLELSEKDFCFIFSPLFINLENRLNALLLLHAEIFFVLYLVSNSSVSLVSQFIMFLLDSVFCSKLICFDEVLPLEKLLFSFLNRKEFRIFAYKNFFSMLLKYLLMLIF